MRSPGGILVKRRGAVAFFALEGGQTIEARLAFLAKQRGIDAPLPFIWCAECPPLTDKDAPAKL